MYFQAPNHDTHWSSQRGMRALLQRQLELENLWGLTHTSALLCSVSVIILSGGVFFISDYVDCDGSSGYGQAALSGLYTFALYAYTLVCVSNLQLATKELNGRNSLSLQIKERRRRSISFWLTITACGQYLAAMSFGLSAYRTLKAPLGLLGLVPIAAILASISCFAAGICNMALAVSVWLSSHVDLSNEHFNKKDAKPSRSEAPKRFYDVDIANLSAFDKGWLAIHLLAFAAIVSAGGTSSLLLWQLPCGDSSRKVLLELASHCFSLPFFQTVAVVRFMLPRWLQRIGHGAPIKDHAFNAVFTLVATFAEALFLAIATHITPNATRGLVLMKLQTTVASWAFFLCGVYDIALMLKTSSNASSSDAADIEKEGGK